MKPYEFMRFFHPKLVRFLYKHKGNGIIIDNILKPMRRVASSLGKTVFKPFRFHLPKEHCNPVFHMLAINWVKKVLKSGDLINEKAGW